MPLNSIEVQPFLLSPEPQIAWVTHAQLCIIQTFNKPTNLAQKGIQNASVTQSSNKQIYFDYKDFDFISPFKIIDRFFYFGKK